MGTFVDNQSEQLDQESPLTPSPTSFPIDDVTAKEYMLNYRNNSLPMDVRLPGTGGIQRINGFYFDAEDIKKLVSNLQNTNGLVFVGLAKKSPLSTNTEDYTVVMTCVEYDVNNDKYNFKYDKNHNPWYEYSKPCPDKCPM